MAVPVLETFAEHGFSIFQSPEAIFADFFAAGIFRRAGIDVVAGSPRLQQREALLDVALGHGLCGIIASYVLAQDSKQEFILKEPVAIQSWAAAHIATLSTLASSSIEQLLVGAKQSVDSQKHLSSLRGLGHVVTALMERLQKATPTALPEVAALTQDALAYLHQLSEQLENTKLLFSFGQWLQEEAANKVHYDAAALTRRFTQHPPMILAAICECAQLPSIVPVPATGMDLWRSLFTRTTPVDVSSAILLYVALEMLATSVKPKTTLTFSQLKTSARRFSRAFHLAPLWEKMIVGLWCIQYNLYTPEALTLLQPAIHLDRSILLAVVHVCLQYQKPAVAWELWSTTPPSEEAVDLLLEMHLAMKQYEGAWKLIRAFPEQNAERIPKLLAWHASQTESASLHQWVLRMTWSPAELPLVHSFLLQDERHHELLVLLYLSRCEYDQAYALAQALPAIASSASLQSLLKAVQLNQATLTSVVPSHTRPHADTSDATSYAPGLYSGRHTTVKITSAPTARALDLDSPDKTTTPAAPSWVKPGKERYEAFGWSSTPQKIAFNNIDNRNALVVGPSLSATNLPSPGKLMTTTNEVQRYNFVDDANTSAPPRILRTPMSASQAGKKSINEPLNPVVARDLFTTPDRSTAPKDTNSTPSLRRNPIRAVRKV